MTESRNPKKPKLPPNRPRAHRPRPSTADEPRVVVVDATSDNLLGAIDQITDILVEILSHLGSGTAAAKARIEDREVEDVFKEIALSAEVRGAAVAVALGDMPVAVAVLAVGAALRMVVDAYKRAANDTIDELKGADGRYPCGHTDDDHARMVDAGEVEPESADRGDRGVKLARVGGHMGGSNAAH
jgi:hypothetical protein